MLSDIICYHPVYQYASQLTYVMSDTRFEEQYGQILLNTELDYEARTRIDFQITVSDPLDNLLSAVIDVTLHVLPFNEFMPGLSNTEYHVSENQVPFPQFSLEASDQDHGLHGQFIFQFDTIGDNLPFTLSEDGVISVTGILDHEGTSDYTIDIKLTDKLDPDSMPCDSSTLTNIQSIQIVVDDVNEQASFVNTPYSFEVLETTQIGAFIGSVECRDPDQEFVDNGRIRYSVAFGTSLISIGLTSGSVTLQLPIDFAVSAGFTVSIRCQDLGVPSLHDTSEVFISVKPVIEFDQVIFTADLPENSGVGTFIQTVYLSTQSIASHNFISLSFSFVTDPTAGVIVIDSITGVLTLNQPVPFGINNNKYVITVQATADVLSSDGTISETITTAQLIINIVNDTYLYFPISYTANVTENVRDISLLTVMAINNVTNTADNILYTLSELSSDFEVNNITGEFLLISPLDKEIQSMYTIVIRAYDMFNTSIRARTFVTVRVLDLNDVTPVCVSLADSYITGHYFAVPQILTPLLNCTDLDAESPNNNITYSLIEYNFPNISIDSTTGRISGIGNLTLGFHDLMVLVLDKGIDPGPLNATEIVTLQVTRNDFNPQFINVTSFIELFENHTLTPILAIFVSDEDTGPPGDVIISYKVISPNNDDVFAINAAIGVLSLIAPLDYERTREYIIELNATDNGRPRRSNTTMLTITVINLNDESPYCGVLPSIQLDFDNHFPDLLYQLSCVDPDNLTDLLFYSINTSNTSSYFSISEEGVIQTISSFVSLSSPIFPVALPIPIVVAENDSDLTSLIYLNVLLGESGFVLEFIASPPLSLPENSPINMPIATFIASANPTQTNLLIRYSIRSITPEDVFEINTISGELTLSQNIDYEDVTEYNVSIRAVDNAIYMNIRILYTTISIIDICDNPPKVNHTQSSIVIPQGTGINVMHTFPCSDRDAGNNGEIFCYVNSIQPIVDSGDPLFVMAGCDLMLNRILNGICELEYNLLINCSDLCDDTSLRTNLSFEFQVNIILEDLERPRLMSDDLYPAAIFILENQTVPFEIDVANDHFIDRDCSPFNQTFFNIIHTPSGYMISDKNEGRIVLNRTIDLEKDELFISRLQPRIRSVLTVYDCEELLSSCQGETNMDFVYVVYIEDVNDNRPYCNSTITHLTIPETDPLNKNHTTSVICYDIDRSADKFGMVYFEIDPNNSIAKETFEVFSSSIQPSVGNARRLKLRLVKPLDYENITQYVVLIRVYDGGLPSLYSDDVITLTVAVASVNEHLPFFENKLEKLSLSEDFNISNIVHTSTVIDLDHAPDNRTLYQLSVNPDEKFLINITNGEITLASSLDREQVHLYRLVVLATEDTLEPHNHTAAQTIEITITDINDNSPQLDLPAVPIQIQQNVSIGEIHSFPCSDADIDDNGIFRCDVTSPVFNNIFILNVKSPNCSLSLESIPVPNCNASLMHDLDINCTDSGYPSLNSSFSVSVVVDLVNLQDPVVSSSLVPIPVSESTPVPTLLIDISQFVSDGDCQNFGVVKFFINNQYPSLPAYLSLSELGEIYLINQLDFDTPYFGSPPSLQLEVVARDNPGAVTSREVIFNTTFLIQDTNDNPPTCNDLSVTISIEEGYLSTHNLSTVCNDIDSGSNGKLNSTFVSDHDSLFLFSNIPYNTSHSLISITLVKSLDFEMTESYTVIVFVSDQGMPQLDITISVTILVININDNTPFFTNPPVSNTIVENDPPGNLSVISADDDDKGIFGQLMYILITAIYDNRSTPIDISIGNTSQFEVGLYSGELRQLMPIDFELNVSFLFGIIAEDLGSPPNYVKEYFNITIENINEFAPNIVLPSPGYILQGAPVNSTVAFVNVTDEDRDDTFSCNIRTDSIPSPTAVGLFTLSSVPEGVYIILDQPVVCNDQLLYQLNIVCTDNAINSQSSLAVFNINILSQDLNIPIPSTHTLSFNINENEALNTVITNIFTLLFDPDCAMNGSYSYSIILQIPINHNYLTINASSGDVLINDNIDYESQLFVSTLPKVEIRIQVHDNLLTGPTPLSSPIILEVNIIDLNDNPHMCTPNDNFSVHEDMILEIPTKITCTDSDTFTNITAKLIEVNSKFSVKMVRIIDTTYRLYVNVTKLNFEDTQNHTLLVLIWDPTNPDFNQTVTLHIQVLSVNEFAPFLFINTMNISENNNVGIELLDLSDYVINTEGNESLIFSMISQEYPFPLELDPNTGILTLNTSLDYENPDHRSIMLQIVVTDTGIPPMSSPLATLTLTLIDLNDNPVTIDYINNQSDFQILQSQNSGIVAKLSCIDPDTYLSNILFNCSLDPSSNPMNFGSDVFFLSYSEFVCDILAIQYPPCIDQFVYNLTVNCENTNDPHWTSSFDIQVHLIPENLVAPSAGDVFPILENTISELDTANFPIIVPSTSDISEKVSDSDCGVFGEILFRVDRVKSRNLEYVSVNNRTGEVTIIREVDAEVLKLQIGTKRINIFIDVVDNNGEVGYLIFNASANATNLITIDIQDDNDEPPSCNIRSLSLTLQEENANMSKVPGGQFICMDNDSCPVPGREITANASYPFGIIATATMCVDETKLYEPAVFEVFAYSINLEVRKQVVYEIEIFVSDSINSITIPATITILDLPEFPIEFSQSSYELIINYTAPVGLVDFFVTATDDDFTSEIRYTSDNQSFSVDYMNGSIYIERNFSLTGNTTFEGIITATELNTADTTAVTLNIIVNHPPIFTKHNVTEYCVDDITTFISLNYSDNNLNTPGQDKVRFYFLSLSNPLLTNITTNSTIEFAAIDASSFSITDPTEYTIIIEDSTGYTDSFSFNVTQCSITRRRRSPETRSKRNIKSLHFTKLTTLVYIPISFSPGSTLPVQSCRSELTLPITYSLLLTNHSDWPFAIEPVSAEIQVSNSLYRLTYHLVIECMNSLHDQIASYVVIVLVQNEYIPIFNKTKTSYEFLVKENSAINTVVGVVLAETLRMHTVSYHVNTVAFDVMQYSGGVILTSALDYEIQSSYSFIVTAINIDIHSIQPSSITSVTVTVTDVNDNPPISVGDLTLVIYISNQQDHPIGQVFDQVFCTDADSPETNLIEYSLETPHLIFDITTIEGYIYLSSNAELLTLEYSNVFITRCTDQAHIPNPAFDRSVITVSTRLHSSITCPFVTSYNLTWPETEPNTTARVLCPETLKIASRVCSSSAEWMYPDMSECDTLHNLPTPIIPLIPETDCFDSFIALYLSNMLLININLADTSVNKLHLAGDLRLAVEYFFTADSLLTCLPLNITALHQVAIRILGGIDLLTQPHFSDAWLTLGSYYQRIVSRQLVYTLNSLTHKLTSLYADSTQLILYNYHHFIANELHPDQISTIHSPYLFTDTLLTFTSCYLQAISQELGLSYFNDTVAYLLQYLLPHESIYGVLRTGVSTSYVGVYSSGYIDNNPNCTFNISFTTRQGTGDHICAVWEFDSADVGHWNADICMTYLGDTEVVCSCRGVGVVGVIGTTPPAVYPDCFPLANLVAFILFILSSITILPCVVISIVLLIVFSSKEYKKPSLYFKLHTLSFLLLAEIVNFIGIFVIRYDEVCEIIAIITHNLFVFVFFWILILSFFHLLQFLFPNKEDILNKFSLALFFIGYAIPLCLVIVSLIDSTVFGILAPPNTSQCKYLYCWISSAIFPTYQLISSALPLIFAQIILAAPLFLHFFIPKSDTETKKLKRYKVNTKLQLSHVYCETIPGYAQVFILGFHYAFLSNAYEGITFGILSFLFTILTSVFLLIYYTGLISFLSKKSARQSLRPKHSATNFINAEDYETRLVSRQHERVNWAFLNAQEERFYEEGRQLGAHFNIATPLFNNLLPD
ncbi:Protocadherin Fat 4-like [Oopsacas minuta]|uniref:Protocadherin Fat 4-like n=1 Tax=Oopsacas minuta TaxID=111878 RepID=A0AAV7JUY6_9METZ|nr:Protocadherin Fat 4-like [Oopsacas minuta]